jgi:NAD(P)-dependent dehydrogenase (short-subunit alcohol dehydrogenase family)
VTGASSGLGRAIAIRLAAGGREVVIGDERDLPREGGVPTHEAIRAAGGTAEFCRTDVGEEDQVRRLIDFCVGTYGSLDVMCNNAGVSGVFTNVADTALADFDRVVRVNFRGVFLGCKHAAARMLTQGRGVIVNTASCFGLVGFPGMATYCATKGAVIQLTRSLALELAPAGIRVNALCPGTIDTEMDRVQREDPASMEDLKLRTPLLMPSGTFAGSPEDQAAAVEFLVSDAARWMTGQCLVMDGGWTAI